MNFEDIMLSIIKAITEGQILPCFHKYEVFKVFKFIEKQSRMIASRDWKEGKMGSCYSICTVSVMQDEKVLQICVTIMCIYLIIL